MYGFWLTVISISMIVLVMIYTFQFDRIKSLWERIGVDEPWYILDYLRLLLERSIKFRKILSMVLFVQAKKHWFG